MSRLVWLIPLFPLLGTLINALFGRFIGHKAHWIAVPALFASFVTSCLVFSRVWHGETWTGDLFPWVVAGPFKTAVTAQVDQLTAVMLLVVTGVGFLIHLYSAGYMHDDDGYARFFTYLNLFVFSMVMLVLAGNFLVLYVFWEAVGLCSYLLIGFWYERKSATDAGKKAFIVNRVGDFGFGLGIMLIWVTFGTLDYGEVFAKADASVSRPAPTWPSRSSCSWARAASRPSCRSSPGCPTRWRARRRSPPSSTPRPWSPRASTWWRAATSSSRWRRSSLEIVAWVGALTALFAATIGLVQTDIKRVLAYSTISQLGYMFVGVRRGRVRGRHLPPGDPRLLQGPALPGRGQRDPRPRRRAGHAEDGRPRPAHDDHHRDVPGRGLRPRGRPAARRASSRRTRSSARRSTSTTTLLWALLVVGAFMTAFYTFRLVFLAFFGGPAHAEGGGAPHPRVARGR